MNPYISVPLTPGKNIKYDYTWLKGANLAAAVLHAVSFTALFITTVIISRKSYQAELTVDFRVYDGVNNTVNRYSGPYKTTADSIGFVRIVWVQLWFPLVTSLFHFYIYKNVETVYKEVLTRKCNKYRWIEYAITTPLMTFTISQLSGITNIFLLLSISVIMNTLLQFCGWLIESTQGDVQLASLLSGWCIFTFQWTVIFAYFYAATTSHQVPDFVYTVIIVLFFLFSLFGVNQTYYVFFTKYTLDDVVRMEYKFILLSFVSKASLDWIIMIGLLQNGMAETS